MRKTLSAFILGIGILEAGELKEHCGVITNKFIKHYSIPKTLPELMDVCYEMPPSETRLTDIVFLEGDTQIKGSLPVAIISGEDAANGVMEMMSSTISQEKSSGEIFKKRVLSLSRTFNSMVLPKLKFRS